MNLKVKIFMKKKFMAALIVFRYIKLKRDNKKFKK